MNNFYMVITMQSIFILFVINSMTDRTPPLIFYILLQDVSKELSDTEETAISINLPINADTELIPTI